MDKPRIFLGSSGKQEKLLQALTRGLEDVARVEPWTTSFNPGTTTLERLLELAHEVDFAAFVFAQDDWTTHSPPPSALPGPGQASPRDNVVFEAGLFGGALGMRRTFILHSSGSKLPSDRERGPNCPYRRPVVAVFPDGAHREGAFRREPSEDFA
jgi:predicted nucleotide-binding protein